MDKDVQEHEKYAFYERVHLRKLPDSASVAEKTENLEKRDRNKVLQIIFNILAILFFAYSWYANINTFQDWVYIILMIIFAVNVMLILYQRKQIHELQKYYERK